MKPIPLLLALFSLATCVRAQTAMHPDDVPLITVRPGSFILIPPSVVRSIRASKGEVLEFYAITTPAWSSDDDVLTTAPEGAPR